MAMAITLSIRHNKATCKEVCIRTIPIILAILNNSRILSKTTHLIKDSDALFI
jgi:hypothetical protein